MEQRLRIPRRLGSQFTLIEMLGVITIIAILASLLMPALARTRATARQVECLSRQRQLGIAMTLYVKKNDQVFPAHRNNSLTSG
jgi:prepilin-type N-terminal cleavage/methylation domain-containing protein